MEGQNSRISRLRDKLQLLGLDGMLVTSPVNWRYLSGFRGDSGMLLVTSQEAFIFTDSRYVEQAQNEAPGFQVVKTSHGEDVVRKVLDERGIRKLGFEKDNVTCGTYEKFVERFSGVELVGLSGVVEDLRIFKSPEEIEWISHAQGIAEKALELVMGSIRVGAREVDIALELEFAMRKLGSEGVAFPVIAVSGERSSLPHGEPGERRLSPGDFFTLDFGARCNGYCSDMTRTFVIGTPDDRHREIYNIVLEAQMAALGAVRPGIPAKDVDHAGRKVIEDAGYGEYFGHSIGHGVGLKVHEGPAVSRVSDKILEPGMVITIEPGIYIPGFGGVRIEDLVVVTESGALNLTRWPKQLTVIEA